MKQQRTNREPLTIPCLLVVRFCPKENRQIKIEREREDEGVYVLVQDCMLHHLNQVLIHLNHYVMMVV
jgi:hypothetical protein